MATSSRSGWAAPNEAGRASEGVMASTTGSPAYGEDRAAQGNNNRKDSTDASAMAERSGSGHSEFAVLLFAIISYSTVSISVVYFNWWVFTRGFKYPVFVSWIQQVVGFVMFYTGAMAGYVFPSLRPLFPVVCVNRRTAMQVAPLTSCFVLMVGLANICLQKTLVSTYMVARSLTLLFVIILSYYMLHQKQSIPTLIACSFMVLGFIIGSLDPSTLQIGGLIAGGVSSFFQSLYNVTIKKTLPVVHDNNQLLLFYNLALSSVLFIPMVLATEDLIVFKHVVGAVPETADRLWIIWGAMILSGIMGTTLNMTTYLCVKVSSPLTFNIVGFSKSLLQSLGGVVFLNDTLTVPSATGLLLALVGSAGYTKVKYDETKAKKALEAVPQEDLDEHEPSPQSDLSRHETTSLNQGDQQPPFSKNAAMPIGRAAVDISRPTPVAGDLLADSPSVGRNV